MDRALDGEAVLKLAMRDRLTTGASPKTAGALFIRTRSDTTNISHSAQFGIFILFWKRLRSAHRKATGTGQG